MVSPLTGVNLSTVDLPPLDNTIEPWPGTFHEVDGHSLHVRETPGPGPTAVYVHGLGGSATNWTDLAQQLSNHVHGYAIDLPGFGRSEPIPGYDFSLSAHAETVTRFVERLETPVHLFGNSMGGAISALVAAQRPDLVRTLTLVSPAVPDLRPHLSRVSDPRLPLAYVPFVGRRVRKQLAQLTARERTDQMLRLCFAEPGKVPEHRVEETIRENEERAAQKWAQAALGQSTIGLMRAWFAPRSRSLWNVLPRVEAPTLVVWGVEDKLVTVNKGPRTVKSLRDGRLLVLPRTGHVAQMERPATVARAVLGMWEALDRHTW